MVFVLMGFAGLLAGIFYLVAVDARRTVERLEPAHRVPGQALVGEETEAGGQVSQRTPMKSPLGGRECVYYKFSIRLDWAKRPGALPPGVPQPAPPQGREVNGERAEDFFLDTPAGRVLVRTQGARFDLSSRATRRVGIEEVMRTEHPGLVQVGALVAALAGVSANETVVEQGAELFVAGRRLVDAPLHRAGNGTPDIERGPTLSAWFIADRPKDVVLADWSRTAARADLACKVFAGIASVLALVALLRWAARAVGLAA
jgi:hypothetical protein